MPRHRSWMIGALVAKLTCIILTCMIGGLIPVGGASGQNGGGGAVDANGQPANRGFTGGPQQQSQPLAENTILPRPFAPLTAEHEAYIDQLLEYWEHSSSQIDVFECRFNRWVYDPIFGPRPDANGQHLAKTISKGEIKFRSPDKGMFFVENVWQYDPQQPENREPYSVTTLQEQWICDGTQIFDFKYESSQLMVYELPPELQGQGLAHGPLPFLFGATQENMRARYWLRCITPTDTTGQYWLEAYPKYPADAQNYYKVVVILDEEAFLPMATEIFDPNYHPDINPSRTFFEFTDREIHLKGRLDLNLLAQWQRTFFQPVAPRGWETIRVPFQDPAASEARIPDSSGGGGFQR